MDRDLLWDRGSAMQTSSAKNVPPPKKARKSIFMRAERTQSGTVLCASVGVLTAADVQGGYSDALTEVREVCHSERQGQVSQKER